MKITILGSSGFIGSALSRYLEENGEQVIRLKRPDFDLNLPSTFTQIPSDTDIVIHAATCVGNDLDGLIWKTNVISTYYLIQYLNTQNHPCLVIYLSSGAVYGAQSRPITLSSPLCPDSLYGISKLLAEYMIGKILRSKSVILRLFFPFGPGQSPPRLIPRLIQQISKNKAVMINSQPGPTINPIFINDLVYQITKIIQNPIYTHYNLGGSKTVSIRKISEIISQYLGKTLTFRIQDKPIEDLVCRPDLLCEEELSFKEEVAMTIAKAEYI